MFRSFLDEIEKKLKEKKEELEKELNKLGDWRKGKNGFQVDFPEYGTKEDENADEVSAFSDRFCLGLNLEKRLKEVNLALEKIKKGNYGTCESCGKKIPKERLRAFPTARFCLDCINQKK